MVIIRFHFGDDMDYGVLRRSASLTENSKKRAMPSNLDMPLARIDKMAGG